MRLADTTAQARSAALGDTLGQQRIRAALAHPPFAAAQIGAGSARGGDDASAAAAPSASPALGAADGGGVGAHERGRKRSLWRAFVPDAFGKRGSQTSGGGSGGGGGAAGGSLDHSRAPTGGAGGSGDDSRDVGTAGRRAAPAARRLFEHLLVVGAGWDPLLPGAGSIDPLSGRVSGLGGAGGASPSPPEAAPEAAAAEAAAAAAAEAPESAPRLLAVLPFDGGAGADPAEAAGGGDKRRGRAQSDGGNDGGTCTAHGEASCVVCATAQAPGRAAAALRSRGGAARHDAPLPPPPPSPLSPSVLALLAAQLYPAGVPVRPAADADVAALCAEDPARGAAFALWSFEAAEPAPGGGSAAAAGLQPLRLWCHCLFSATLIRGAGDALLCAGRCYCVVSRHAAAAPLLEPLLRHVADLCGRAQFGLPRVGLADALAHEGWPYCTAEAGAARQPLEGRDAAVAAAAGGCPGVLPLAPRRVLVVGARWRAGGGSANGGSGGGGSADGAAAAAPPPAGAIDGNVQEAWVELSLGAAREPPRKRLARTKKRGGARALTWHEAFEMNVHGDTRNAAAIAAGCSGPLPQALTVSLWSRRKGSVKGSSDSKGRQAHGMYRLPTVELGCAQPHRRWLPLAAADGIPNGWEVELVSWCVLPGCAHWELAADNAAYFAATAAAAAAAAAAEAAVAAARAVEASTRALLVQLTSRARGGRTKDATAELFIDQVQGLAVTAAAAAERAAQRASSLLMTGLMTGRASGSAAHPAIAEAQREATLALAATPRQNATLGVVRELLRQLAAPPPARPGHACFAQLTCLGTRAVLLSYKRRSLAPSQQPPPALPLGGAGGEAEPARAARDDDSAPPPLSADEQAAAEAARAALAWALPTVLRCGKAGALRALLQALGALLAGQRVLVCCSDDEPLPVPAAGGGGAAAAVPGASPRAVLAAAVGALPLLLGSGLPGGGLRASVVAALPPVVPLPPAPLPLLRLQADASATAAAEATAAAADAAAAAADDDDDFEKAAAAAEAAAAATSARATAEAAAAAEAAGADMGSAVSFKATASAVLECKLGGALPLVVGAVRLPAGWLRADDAPVRGGATAFGGGLGEQTPKGFSLWSPLAGDIDLGVPSLSRAAAEVVGAVGESLQLPGLDALCAELQDTAAAIATAGAAAGGKALAAGGGGAAPSAADSKGGGRRPSLLRSASARFLRRASSGSDGGGGGGGGGDGSGDAAGPMAGGAAAGAKCHLGAFLETVARHVSRIYALARQLSAARDAAQREAARRATARVREAGALQRLQRALAAMGGAAGAGDGSEQQRAAVASAAAAAASDKAGVAADAVALAERAIASELGATALPFVERVIAGATFASVRGGVAAREAAAKAAAAAERERVAGSVSAAGGGSGGGGVGSQVSRLLHRAAGRLPHLPGSPSRRRSVATAGSAGLGKAPSPAAGARGEALTASAGGGAASAGGALPTRAGRSASTPTKLESALGLAAGAHERRRAREAAAAAAEAAARASESAARQLECGAPPTRAAVALFAPSDDGGGGGGRPSTVLALVELMLGAGGLRPALPPPPAEEEFWGPLFAAGGDGGSEQALLTGRHEPAAWRPGGGHPQQGGAIAAADLLLARSAEGFVHPRRAPGSF